MDISKMRTQSPEHKKSSSNLANISLKSLLSTNNRKQFSSLILFVSVIIIVNLCPPFQPDLEPTTTITRCLLKKEASFVGVNNNEVSTYCEQDGETFLSVLSDSINKLSKTRASTLRYHLNTCLNFIGLMFTNPIKLGKRTVRYTVADAKVLGKMAKVWYIKKKIKKLSKKLKKHTIAVPVFTAIPIYEHSYYPQPHVTHVTHGGMHHAAASSYSPTAISPLASGSNQASAVQNQQLITSASNTHHQIAPAYHRMGGHFQHHNMYQPMQTGASAAHQIINSYAPSPPLYVDEAGGLYGHYGNAYGRYDGGYQLW